MNAISGNCFSTLLIKGIRTHHTGNASLCKHGGVSTKIDYITFIVSSTGAYIFFRQLSLLPKLSASGESYDHRQRLFVVRCAKRCRQCMFGLELINDFLKLKSLKPIGRTCGDWTNRSTLLSIVIIWSWWGENHDKNVVFDEITDHRLRTFCLWIRPLCPNL